MDPTQQAASQIIKGGTVTALTVSIKPPSPTSLLYCHAPLCDSSLPRSIVWLLSRNGMFSIRVARWSYAIDL